MLDQPYGQLFALAVLSRVRQGIRFEIVPELGTFDGKPLEANSAARAPGLGVGIVNIGPIEG